MNFPLQTPVFCTKKNYISKNGAYCGMGLTYAREIQLTCTTTQFPSHYI